jgi:hypothetical protein
LGDFGFAVGFSSAFVIARGSFAYIIFFGCASLWAQP